MQTKVVIFDFDGTLTISNSSTWSRIWKKLDALDVDYKYYKMYANNEIDYETWVKLIVEYLQERNYNEHDLNELVFSMKFIDNLELVLKFFKEKQIQVYILSGGIKIVIEKALGNLKCYIKQIEATNFVFDNSKLIGYTVPIHNPENKCEFVSYVMEKENVTPKQVLFVGNGKNDETVYKTGVNTLCLNADDANYNNKEIWHSAIFTNNLEDILHYISC